MQIWPPASAARRGWYRGPALSWQPTSHLPIGQAIHGVEIRSFTKQLSADDVVRVRAAILERLQAAGWTVYKPRRDIDGRFRHSDLATLNDDLRDAQRLADRLSEAQASYLIRMALMELNRDRGDG